VARSRFLADIEIDHEIEIELWPQSFFVPLCGKSARTHLRSRAFAKRGESDRARNRIASKAQITFLATKNTKAHKKTLCSFVFFVAKKAFAEVHSPKGANARMCGRPAVWRAKIAA
jgi:hypothetical protein